MELLIPERLALLEVLDGIEGSLAEVRAAAKLRAELVPMQAERDAIDWEQDERGVRWNATKDTGVDIEVTDDARAACVRALKALDESGKLAARHLPLCDKFGLE